MADAGTPFYVGHHESRRALPITAQVIENAHAANYDMLTCAITTPHFHSRVMTLLSSALRDGSPSAALDIAQQRNGSPVVLPPLTPADSSLTPSATINQIVGLTSPWIDLCSPDPIIADLSRQVLKLELSYAAFCGLTYVLIAGPALAGLADNEAGLAQYGRAVLDCLSQAPFIQFHIWLPIMGHQNDDKQEIGDLRLFTRPAFLPRGHGKTPPLDLFGSWEAWNVIRSICKYSSRLFVALDLPKLVPPAAVQSRWYSEPVRLLTLDASIFVKNPKGYPVLSKAHQALITRFVRLRTPPWFLLSNCGPIPQATAGNSLHNLASPAIFPTPAESSQSPAPKDANASPHLSYLRNLQSKQPPLGPIERFGAGYQDFLQAPLQPLAVNLESITYEVFERDPVKYDQYEKAIARALHDWVEQGKPTSNPDGRVVVAVVGAGRGPLVTRALKASEDVGVDIDLWALEKNPNAFVLLQTHNQTIWNQQVNLVKSDMRTWPGPVREASEEPIRQIYNKVEEEDDEEGVAAAEAADSLPPQTPYTLLTNDDMESIGKPVFYKIDILISELLGSFADNELSPECLDGVQHLLNPVHGVSIPASYTALISPIAAPKLYADINNSMVLSMPNAAEIPYVVLLNAIDLVSTMSAPDSAKGHHQSTRVPAEPVPIIQPTWTFHHPNHTLPSERSTSRTSNTYNSRFSATTFPVPHRAIMHGLAGYFESVLYSGVELSTNPLTMQAKSEDMISWFPIFFPLKQAVYAPDESEVEVCMWRKTDGRKVWYEWVVDVYVRLKGRRTRVGGSELHSSEKEGCLM